MREGDAVDVLPIIISNKMLLEAKNPTGIDPINPKNPAPKINPPKKRIRSKRHKIETISLHKPRQRSRLTAKNAILQLEPPSPHPHLQLRQTQRTTTGRLDNQYGEYC